MSMTIANRLKRIASKWGVESKSHTIEDVLEDLENGLPFSVEKKMVEIVPEQSVTGTIPQLNEGEPEFYSETNPPTEIASLKLKENASYKVVFNGKEYICETELWEQEFTDDGVADVKGYKLSTGSIPNGDVGFTISRGWSVLGGQTEDDGNTVIEWSIDNGETITLAIYEEKEVVTPMNATFADIIISNEDGVFSCNTTYAELRKMCEIDPLSIVNVKYVEKRNINTEIKLTVKQLKNLQIYETQFAFEFGDYNSSTAVLYNSDGTIGTAGPV